LFSGTPKFDLPEISGALIIRIPERPVMGTESISGNTYTSRRHEFAVFPQRAGTVGLPAFPVRFGVGGYGIEPQEYTITTTEHWFETVRPPGTENLGRIISARNFTVQESWNPEPGDAFVGDAFTRTVTFRAPDIPGMAFPPLPFGTVPGMGIYPKNPRVEDTASRGDFIGERIDTITYVCEQPGAVNLPAVILRWWDLDSKKVREEKLPAVAFTVVPAPSSVSDSAVSAGSPELSRLLWTAMLVVAISTGLVWSFRLSLLGLVHDWKIRRAESESAYFGRIIRACQSGNPCETYNALMQWIDRESPGPQSSTITGYLHKNPDQELGKEVKSLQEALMQPKSTWAGNALATALKKHRRNRNRYKMTAETDQLPELNPK
jgi:hypothetical protein